MTRPSPAFARTALAMFMSLAALYIVSQFLRNSVGVIAPDLVREAGLTAFDLGVLSSMFFLAFGLAQLPLGVALDRFGPKICILVCAGVVVLGCLLFATAASASGLIGARLLLGLGSASFLVAPVTLYARWFPPAQFSTMAGLHVGIGTCGALLATSPLAFSTAAIGWRATFVGVAVAAAVLGVVAAFLVKDQPPGKPVEYRRETLGDSLRGLWQVIRTPSIGRLLLVQLANYPSFLLVVGLWGGPYLSHVYGYDLQTRGDVLLIPALVQIVGALFWGPMDRLFGGYKRPILLALGINAAGLVLLAALAGPSLWVLIPALTLLGFSTALSSLVLGYGRTLVPPHLLGRCLALLNIGTMGGGFIVQTLSGWLIGWMADGAETYPIDAYRLAFGLQAAFVLVAAWVCWGAREIHPNTRPD